ncbi:putative thiamine-repressible mitochondrial transport protein THI74-like isoform X1 [Capsicum annuum]|nr:putative thiamine-repressible mitochondrial transport protein THI74-like isoform X1 [Capsicum annuum]
MYSGEEGSRIEGTCLTFVVTLEACSHLTDLDKGKQIQEKIIRALPDADGNMAVGTALVDMYSKSGCVTNTHTHRFFDAMKEKNVVSWTCAGLFMDLPCKSLNFFSAWKRYGMTPKEEHYTCVIDLLGRNGRRLEEAWDLVEGMEENHLPSDGCSTGAIWAALLGACQLYENQKLIINIVLV